jgi:spore maturation protein CgeB
MAAHGLRTILARHTCAHRVDELLAIAASLRPAAVRPSLHGAA